MVDDDLTDSCADCQDVFSFGDAIHCSCGALVCDDCYDKHKHYEHDENEENDWIKDAIEKAIIYAAGFMSAFPSAKTEV